MLPFVFCFFTFYLEKGCALENDGNTSSLNTQVPSLQHVSQHPLIYLISLPSLLLQEFIDVRKTFLQVQPSCARLRRVCQLQGLRANFWALIPNQSYSGCWVCCPGLPTFLPGFKCVRPLEVKPRRCDALQCRNFWSEIICFICTSLFCTCNVEIVAQVLVSW